MAIKKIMLTIPELMMRKLEQEKKNFSYPTVQSIILEALRDRYFKKKEERERRETKKT